MGRRTGSQFKTKIPAGRGMRQLMLMVPQVNKPGS
jgi:hypothetical protein